ncbi:toxin glutamine deamidase domain-containing protein [Streptomyces sp. Marseille-Q5077]|uniref:toxin glutamine deamidase domain-containing protein n=1 Tax=Streptomyces sp. Marseille-Q5077 TaxID=3418995 RepID=UPI003D043D17
MMLPDELEWVLQMLGYHWPTADEDKLRDSAALWRKFGEDVTDLHTKANTSARTVTANNAGESIDKFTKTYEKFDGGGGGDGYLRNAAEAAFLIANVMETCAYLVEFAKWAVIAQLIALAIQIAAAAAAAPFTFGLSSVAGMGATQAARLLVRRILDELKKALLEALIETMKEPAISAIEAIITDLIRQTVNVGFGAQEGYDVGATMKAGGTAGLEALKQSPQTFAEGVRDSMGKKAGDRFHHAIDSRIDGYNGPSGSPGGNSGAGADGSGDGSSNSGSGDGSSGSGDSGSGSSNSNSNSSSDSGSSRSSDSSDSSTSSRSSNSSGPGANIGSGISADTGGNDIGGPNVGAGPDSGSGSDSNSGSGPGQNPSSSDTPYSRPAVAPSGSSLSDFDDPSSGGPSTNSPGSNGSSGTPSSSGPSHSGGGSGVSGLSSPSPQSTPSSGATSSGGTSSSPGSGSIGTQIDGLAATAPTQSNAAPAPAADSSPSSSGGRSDGGSAMPTSPTAPSTGGATPGGQHSPGASGGSSTPSATNPNANSAPARNPSAGTPGTPSATGTGPASTPSATPSTAPRSTPAATPGGTPAATPGSASASTPGSTSAATPGSTSNATPGSTSASTPGSRPASTPDGRAPGAGDGRTPGTRGTPDGRIPAQRPGSTTPGEGSTPRNTPAAATPGDGTPPRSNPGTATPGDGSTPRNNPGNTTPNEGTTSRNNPGTTTPGDSTTPRNSTDSTGGSRTNTPGQNPNTTAPNQNPSTTTPNQNPAQSTPSRAASPSTNTPASTPSTSTGTGPERASTPSNSPHSSTQPGPTSNPATQGTPGTPNQPNPGSTPNRPPHQPAGSTPNTPNQPGGQPNTQQPSANTPNHQQQQPQVTPVPIHHVTQVPSNQPNQSNPPTPDSTPGNPNQQDSSDNSKPKETPTPASETRNTNPPGGVTDPTRAEQDALENSVPRDENGDPTRPPDPADGRWVERINGEGRDAPGRNNNCVDTALSTVDTYAGNPTAAGARTPDHDADGNPSDRGEKGGRDRIENTLGARFSDMGNGRDAFNRLENTLRNSGHGSQAVIITQDANGRAHAWNAVNHNGKITYIDAQTGQQSSRPLHSGNNGVFAIPLDSNRRPVPTHSSESGPRSQPDSTRPSSATPEAAGRRPSEEPAGQPDDPADKDDPHNSKDPADGTDSTDKDGKKDPDDRPYTDPHDRGTSDTADESQRVTEGGPESDTSRTHEDPEKPTSREYGIEPDALQHGLRENREVHRVDLDRVHDSLDRWTESGELARVLRETERGNGNQPHAFTRDQLSNGLKGFGNLSRGEQQAVVASLARLSFSFHQQHSVGQNPERVQHPYREPGEPAPEPGTKDRGGKKSGESLGVKLHRKFVNTMFNAGEFKNLPKEQSDALKRHGPDFSGKNFAVLEVQGPPPDREVTYVVDSSVPASLPGVTPRHSEQHLLDWLQRVDPDGTQYKPVGLYTEREPCGQGQGHMKCSNVLQHERFAGTPIHYSATYRDDPAGVQQRDAMLPDKQAAVDAVGDLSDQEVKEELRRRVAERLVPNSKVLEPNLQTVDGMSAEAARARLETEVKREHDRMREAVETHKEQAIDAEMTRHMDVLERTWDKLRLQLVPPAPGSSPGQTPESGNTDHD